MPHAGPYVGRFSRRPSGGLADLLARLLALVAFAVTCVASADPAPPASRALLPRLGKSAETRLTQASLEAPGLRTVVIVVIDGARWQEMFVGVDPMLARLHRLARREVLEASKLLPEIHAIVDRGGAALGVPGHGAEISASGPAYLSLPGYTELFSGRPATSCRSNNCPNVTQPTLVDDLIREQALGPRDVTIFSSWPGILHAIALDRSRALVSAGQRNGSNLSVLKADPQARRLFELGARSKNQPGQPDYRPDRHTAALALHWLRTNRPRLLFLSLGDADEYAHFGSYRRYLSALRESDAVIGELARSIDELNAAGWPAALFVTADHGRDRHCRDHGAKSPESARSFLIATGAGIARGGAVDAPRARHLADLAPTLRVLMRLEPQLRPDSGEVMTELLDRPRALLADAR